MFGYGLDYVSGPPIATLKSARVDGEPITFVCRYLSEVNAATQVKLLTPAEAKTLSEAGISVVSNYEWTGTTPLGGHDAGVFDAQIARDQHAACGGPANRPIYFSVDFDATPGQMPAIIDYFHGVASVIGLSRTGAYGSYFTIKALLDAKAITWAWQTYAWSGGQWDSRAHIQQYDNGVTFAGLEVDYDRAMKPDFGQWTLERTTWVSTSQQAQAQKYWESTTAGSIPAGGNAPVPAGIFPAGHAPNYGTGIAQSWQSEYMNGRLWGPPLSYEFATVDWSGNAIVAQMFAGGRCEWNTTTHAAKWYAWQ